MGTWLKAFALFALLVAVPFAMEQLLGSHPEMSFGGPVARKDCRSECLKGDCEKNCVKPGASAGASWWNELRPYGLAAAFVLPLLVFLIVLLLFLPKTYQIADWLTLAEREMNALLRAWGGGYSGESRKNVVKERADWISMIPDTDDPAPFADIYNKFFDLNQKDLESGGPQAAAMGKVRMTAFLLRELYEGNVKNAQLKIFNEFENSPKKPKEPPFIAPGIRQIVGFDRFKPDIKLGDPNYENYEYGFPKGAGVDWFPLWLTVKLNRFPRSIVMTRADKSRVYNRDVIEELNVQAAPAQDEPPVSVPWLRLLESRDLALLFLRWVAYLIVVALTIFILWGLLH